MQHIATNLSKVVKNTGKTTMPDTSLHQSRSQSRQAFLSANRPLHETANQKKDVLFEFPSVSPGDQPLTKKPEDSEIEIVPSREALKPWCVPRARG